MRVLLVSPNTERLNMVALPLGLGLVAAATEQAGHEVELVDLLGSPDPVTELGGRLDAFGPDAIGISVRNVDDQSSERPRFLLESLLPVVAVCRRHSTAPVVLGGAGYSIFPARVLDYLGGDFGVAGDGEEVFVRLLAALLRGDQPADLEGVYMRGRGGRRCSVRAPLDQASLFHDRLFDCARPDDPELWVPLETRRGCANDCSYCATAQIQGRQVRCHAPRRVAATVSRLAERGLRRVYFVDNAFNLPEGHALDLCQRLGELARPVAWRCILYPHRVSEPLVQALGRAGCVEVSLGFESGSQRVLGEMNKRYRPQEVREAADRLRDRGIRRTGFLLLGGPGETRESVEESLDFALSLGLDTLRVTVGLRIYPGTALERRALTDGLISPGDDLLRPRFYLVPELEDFIRERLGAMSLGVGLFPGLRTTHALARSSPSSAPSTMAAHGSSTGATRLTTSSGEAPASSASRAAEEPTSRSKANRSDSNS
jgi:hypothetical protein